LCHHAVDIEISAPHTAIAALAIFRAKRRQYTPRLNRCELRCKQGSSAVVPCTDRILIRSSARNSIQAFLPHAFGWDAGSCVTAEISSAMICCTVVRMMSAVLVVVDKRSQQNVRDVQQHRQPISRCGFPSWFLPVSMWIWVDFELAPNERGSRRFWVHTLSIPTM